MIRNSEYEQAKALIQEAKENLNLQKELVERELESEGVLIDELRDVLDKYPLEKLRTLLENEENVKATYDRIKVQVENDPNYIEEPESQKSWILDAAKNLSDLMESEKEIEDMEKENGNGIKEYHDYMNSTEYEEERLKSIERMKKEVEEEKQKEKPEYQKIRKLENEITLKESRYTLSFIESKYLTVDKITDAFFTNQKSDYMMRKFIDKCKQIHMDPRIYHYFFSIEEKYLEEKYHPFNNLYLFRVMQFISHADAHQRENQIRMIISTLSNLIFDSFVSEDAKNTFLDSIRKFLDQFIDAGKTEEFMEKNILRPGHEYRIEKEKEREKEARKSIYEMSLKNGWVEDTKSLEELPYEELVKFVNKKQEEEEAAKKEEYEKGRLQLIEPEPEPDEEVKEEDTPEPDSEETDSEEPDRVEETEPEDTTPKESDKKESDTEESEDVDVEEAAEESNEDEKAGGDE